MKKILNFSLWLKVKTWIVVAILATVFYFFWTGTWINSFADPKGAAILYFIFSMFVIMVVEVGKEMEHNIDEIEPGM